MPEQNPEAGQRPDFKRAEYVAAAPDVALCRDLMKGTRAIQDAGEVYLPRWSAEDPRDYKARSRAAKVFRGYLRTVQASVGMVTATPPALDEAADPLIAKDAEDIDGRGTHLEVFAKQVFEDGLGVGIFAILVDYPPVPEDVNLRADQELALGLRPYWVAVRREQIISWVVEVPDWSLLVRLYIEGLLTDTDVKSFARQVVVRQVVIHEPTDVADGPYGMRCVDRYRVLRLSPGAGVTFEVYEKQQDKTTGKEVFLSISSGTMRGANRKALSAIPLAVGYTGLPTAPFVADPPLLALAELNIDHYQVSADRRYLMRICHAPTFVISGATEEEDENGKKKEFKVGPNHTIILPDPQAKAEWVAADPAALDSSQAEKDDLLKQMAALGMSFLAKDRRGQAETAMGRKLDDAAENATHATASRGLQDCLEQAMKFHAEYRGVEPASVLINTSYAAEQMDPAVLNLLWQAVLNGRLDMNHFIYALQHGDLPDDLEIDTQDLKRFADEMALADAATAKATADATPDDTTDATQNTKNAKKVAA